MTKTEIHVQEAVQTRTGVAMAAEYWPHLVVGAFIAMVMVSVNGQAPAWMIWLPPLALVGWFTLGWLLQPRVRPQVELTPEQQADLATVPEPAMPVVMEKAPEPVAPVVADQAPTPAPSPAAQSPEPAAPAPAPAPATPAADVDASTIAILWGSESGNAESLAEMAEVRLNQAGLSAKAMDMGDVNLAKLQGFKQVLVLTSTWGDGDPPSNAISLWEEFQNKKVDLSHVQFSVLALGDTAYTQFCKCGQDFDEFLEAQGAKRIYPRVDCDLDFEAPFDGWISGVTEALKQSLAAV